MCQLNNRLYKNMLEYIVNDFFYSSASIYGKIGIARKYVEIIIRQILGLSLNDKVTIGNHKIKSQILKLPNSQYFFSAYDKIYKKLNIASHTQLNQQFSKNDLEIVTDCILDIFAFIFINYFEKYKFGTNKKVIQNFSLLPPILRYKVLIFLYEKDNTNTLVISKLALVLVKEFGYNRALQWLMKEQDNIKKLNSIAPDVYDEISQKISPNYAKELQKNMFQVVLEQIETFSSWVDENGIVYKDFESALPYAQELYKREC